MDASDTSLTLAEFESSLEHTGLSLHEIPQDGARLPPAPELQANLKDLIEQLPRIRTDGTENLVRGRTLGKGGMGVVRAAEQRSMGREVAIKSLSRDNLTESSIILLLREAWVVGLLEHPNIVPMYEVGLDEDGNPVIVMKRVEGTPWCDFIRGEANLPKEAQKDPLPWHLRVFMQVCNAVQFASTKGIVHRDLKPANVMIGSFGEVYVMDWGLAVSIEDRHGGRLLTTKDIRSIAGTPGYMAPEMIDKQGSRIGLHTDIYLLGAILHEVMLGVPRHRGRTTVEMMYSSFISDAFKYPTIVPKELALIANRAMSPDPADRFRDADSLKAAVQRFVNRQGARRLVNEADPRLELLRERVLDTQAPLLGRIAADNLFAECRFAYQLALRDWPDNEAAKKGLQECVELMVQYELRAENAEAAQARLAELPVRRPDFAEKVHRLAQRTAARQREYETLKRQKADRDLRIGSRARSLSAIVLALLWAAFPAGLGTAKRGLGYEISYPRFFVAAGLVGLVAVGVHYALRKELGRTLVDRQLAASVYLGGIATLLTKFAGWGLGLEVELTMLFDLMIFTLVAALVAVTLERKVIWVVGVFLVGFLVGARYQNQLFFTVAITQLLAFLIMGYIWLPVRPPPSETRAI